MTTRPSVVVLLTVSLCLLLPAGMPPPALASPVVVTRESTPATGAAAALRARPPLRSVADLRVTVRKARTVRLAWTNPRSRLVERIVVRRARGPDAPTRMGAGAPVPLPLGRAAGVTDRGLTPDSTYSYSVFTKSSRSERRPGRAIITVSTDVMPPAAVTDLRVLDRGARSIALSWKTPATPDLARVVVRRSTGLQAARSLAHSTMVPLDGPSASAVTDEGLAPATRYTYTIITVDRVGNERARMISTVTEPARPWEVRPPPRPPGPPRGSASTALRVRPGVRTIGLWMPKILVPEDVQPQEITGGLELVVTDLSGSDRGWHVTVSLSDFVGYAGGSPAGSIPAEAFLLTQVTGPQRLAGREAAGIQVQDLGSPADPLTLVAAAEGAGQGSYRLSYDTLLRVPANTAGGIYSATATLSIVAGP